MSTQPHRFSSEKLLEILSLSQNATAIYTGKELTIQTANNAMIGLWGRDRTVIGKTLIEALPELEGQPFIGILQNVWETGITYEDKNAAAELLIDEKLQTFYFDFVYRAIRNEAGEVDCILSTATDVTEQYINRKALQETELHLRLAIDGANVGVWHMQPKTQTINFSPVLKTLFGYEGAGQISYEELYQQITPEYRVPVADAIKKAVTDKTNYDFTYSQRRFNDGKLIWLRTLGKATKGSEGNYGVSSGVIIDVTEQVKAQQEIQNLNKELDAINEEIASSNEELSAANEELATTNEELSENRRDLQKLVTELEASEFKIRGVIQSAPFPIGVYTGREMRVTFANKAITDVWGKGDEVIGKLYAEILPELSNQEVFAQLDSVFTTGIPFQARNQRIDLVVKGKLKTFYFNYHFIALTNPDGEIYGVMNTAADVTDAVLAKQEVEEIANEFAALNEELAAANEEQSAVNDELLIAKRDVDIQRERLYQFFMQAPAGICILNGPDLVYELVNPGYQQLLPGRELLKRPIFEALPELAGTPLQEILLNVYRTGEGFNINELLVPVAEYEGGPEQHRYFTFNYLARKDDSGITDGILAFIFEVTEQVNARKLLEQSEERMRMAMEAADLGSFYINVQDRIFFPSPRFKEFFGFEQHEEVPYEAAINQIHPDYRQAAASMLEAAITKGFKFDMEFPIIGHKDEKTRWVRGIGTVQHNSNDKDYFTGVLHEITEQKRDEQRKNDFIGMVSHELKTPLTTLNAYLQLLQKKAGGTENTFTTGALEKSVSQVKKMTTMINGFLNVSRLESGKIHIDRQRFDMAELVRETEEESLTMIASHEIIFAPVVETFVNADRDKIGQVINNFISNAVKYSPIGSAIHVACVTVKDRAQISVKDKGMGISQQDISKLFERYYRAENVTASSISGFGIGLYLSAEIIHRHDGKIWVESSLGEGSTFYFSLPVAW